MNRWREQRLSVSAIILSLFAALCCRAAAESPPGSKTPGEVRLRLSGILDSASPLQGWWGVSVVCLENGVRLYATNEDRHFTPASTTKLFTVAAGLHRFGPDYRIRTSFLAQHGPNAAGELDGDLVVVGRGDPTFASRLHHGGALAAVQPAVDSLKKSGVRQVDGRLVADNTFFHAAPYGSGWEWDDFVESYAAPVSSLSIDDNAVRITVRPGSAISDPAAVELPPFSPFSVVDSKITTRDTDGLPAKIEYERQPGSDRLALRGTIAKNGLPAAVEAACPDPAARFTALLRGALETNGISIHGSNVITTTSGAAGRPWNGWSEIAFAESPPLSELAGLILKPSQNLYAQTLLLEIGADTEHAPRAGEPYLGIDHEQAGLRVMRKFLDATGITPGDVQLDEGAGLSRRNVVTPRAMVQLLLRMGEGPLHGVWLSALPTGGVDGTLQSRFTQGAAHEHVHAKTGSLRGVHALAGYVTTRSGQTLAFAIMGNQLAGSQSAAARKIIDQLVETLAEFEGKIGD